VATTRPSFTRRTTLLAVATAAIVFVAISILLARAFGAEGAERSAIVTLVQAEARGDAAGATGLIADCTQQPACRQRIAQDAAALKHPGSVSILQLEPSTSFALAGSTGTARIAWRADGSLPIVQCVRVQHTGNVFIGLHVKLLALTARLPSASTCPARF
jgi:hypothetical protein